jgi:hypothetical protein
MKQAFPAHFDLALFHQVLAEDGVPAAASYLIPVVRPYVNQSLPEDLETAYASLLLVSFFQDTFGGGSES